MQVCAPIDSRPLRRERVESDLLICGGGLAGCCAAIAAARSGLRVTLVQDRPVLGGNASSEVRLWALGATSHMGNNNRWAREGGIINELAVENTYRNPDGNSLIFDTILLEKVTDEPNITLMLNTAVFEVNKQQEQPDRIASVRAFCSQNSTRYDLHAPLFVDASGDGIIGFLAGAAFRMGAEARNEFDEGFAPNEKYGHLLGHSIYFMSKDVGHPVPYVPPSFAYRDIEKVVPRYRDINVNHQACQFWWIEYGGRLDTVHDTEKIKWELWRIVYGVWDYIKNSGKFANVDNLTLEWVGHIPGKRESRRFEGDYMLHQRDIVEQREHEDAVSFGGWALDLHPADGVFSEKPGCNQWHSKGVYQIPYRCMYSRNIDNLFLTGRLISATHVAFGSTRVMMTCAHNAAAVGVAATLCRKHGCLPRELYTQSHIGELQTRLYRIGQYMPRVKIEDNQDLAQRATIQASSTLALQDLACDGPERRLRESWAMMLPMKFGRVPRIGLYARADAKTELEVELRASSRFGNHTPDVVLASQTVALQPTQTPAHALAAIQAGANKRADGSSNADEPVPKHDDDGLNDELPGTHRDLAGGSKRVELDFDVTLDEAQYVFICLKMNADVVVRCSDQRVTGILALQHKVNKRVATANTQTPPDELGVDAFEIWLPERRPHGHNIALTLDEPLKAFGVNQLTNHVDRPVASPNAWVADPQDANPTLTLTWDEPQTIQTISLAFDTDFDHPMESTLWQHPERITPFCVQRYRIRDEQGAVIAERTENYQTLNEIVLEEPITTHRLTIELEHPSRTAPASLFAVRCYASAETRV